MLHSHCMHHRVAKPTEKSLFSEKCLRNDVQTPTLRYGSTKGYLLYISIHAQRVGKQSVSTKILTNKNTSHLYYKELMTQIRKDTSSLHSPASN